MAEGPEGLWEVAQGRGRKPEPGLAERVVKATLESKPDGQTHWGTRTMAEEQGVDQRTVHRTWQEHGLQPHRQETFKLARPRIRAEALGFGGRVLEPAAERDRAPPGV